MINQQFVEHEMQHFTYVNREEDLNEADYVRQNYLIIQAFFKKTHGHFE